MKAYITSLEYSPSKEVVFVRCKPEQIFSFKEGQFMMVSSDHIHPGLGKQLKKPYSIATTNTELQTQGTIGFIVKKVCEGFMSDYLTTDIQVGDSIHLQGPVGHMYDTGVSNKYLLLSVGSGLSPMIGLYNALHTNENNTIAMLYGERYLDQILPSTIEIFEQQSTTTQTKIFLSKQENTIYNSGYIQGGLDDAIGFLGTTDISVFICGKPAMVDEVKQILVEKGVDLSRITAEKY